MNNNSCKDVNSWGNVVDQDILLVEFMQPGILLNDERRFGEDRLLEKKIIIFPSPKFV